MARTRVRGRPGMRQAGPVIGSQWLYIAHQLQKAGLRRRNDNNRRWRFDYQRRFDGFQALFERLAHMRKSVIKKTFGIQCCLAS